MAAFFLKGLAILIVAALTAFYLNYPAPTDADVSQDVLTWKTAKSAKSLIYNNNRIFYKDAPGRKAQGPVVVCLHGFPTSSHDWLKVWPALLEKFSRVIAPDFIGFGLSDKPADHEYSIMEQADIVEHLLSTKFVRDVHILAHDYGDTVAQELLARFEDRKTANVPGLVIHSVSLLNGGIFPETNFPRPMQKALLIPYLNSVLVRLTNFLTFKRAFGEVFGPETQPTELEFRDFWALVRKNDGHLVAHKLLQYIPERSANRDRWTGVLQKTSVPVQTIYGPADPVNPPGFVAFYKETVPNPRVAVLPGHIGHYPQWEDPAGVMEEYFTFIRTLPFKPTPARSAHTEDEADDPIISPPAHLKRKVEKLREEKAEAEKKKAMDAKKKKVPTATLR